MNPVGLLVFSRECVCCCGCCWLKTNKRIETHLNKQRQPGKANRTKKKNMEIKLLSSLIVMSAEISKVVKQRSKLLGHNGGSGTGNQGEGQTNEWSGATRRWSGAILSDGGVTHKWSCNRTSNLCRRCNGRERRGRRAECTILAGKRERWSTLFQSKDMELQAHAIPETELVIVIRFTNRKALTELPEAGQEAARVRCTVFLKRPSDQKECRHSKGRHRSWKKKKQSEHTSHLECKVWIKLNGSPAEARNIMVRELN